MALADEIPGVVQPAWADYRQKIDALSQQSLDQLSKASQECLNQLEQFRTKAQGDGNLDEVLALDQEIAARKAGQPGSSPSSSKGVLKALRDLEVQRERIERQLASDTRRLREEFSTVLLGLEKSETQAGRLESALATRTYRENLLKSSLPRLDLKSVSAGTATAGQWVDLLEWTQGVDWAPRGTNWNEHLVAPVAPTGVTLKAMRPSLFPLAARIDGNYELECEFTRHGGLDAVAIFFPVGTRVQQLIFGGELGRYDGVGAIDGRHANGNDTTRVPTAIKLTQRYRVRIVVQQSAREARYSVDLDDKVGYFAWSGDISQLSETLYPVTMLRHVWLSSWTGETTFHSVRVRMRSGTIVRDTITDKDRERDLKRGLVRVIGMKPVSASVWSDQRLVNQLPHQIISHGPFIAQEYSICRDFYGAHAPSRLRSPIPPGARSFSTIGVNEGSQSTRFQVWIDSKQVYGSGATGFIPIQVDIPDKAAVLELVVDPIGDNLADHSYWCYPRFHTSEMSKVTDKMLDGRAAPTNFKVTAYSVAQGTSYTHNAKLAESMKSLPIDFRSHVPCDEFLYAHAPSRLKYQIPEGMNHFSAIGYCLYSHHVRFEVWADDKLLYASPQAGLAPIHVRLPPKAKMLELRINDQGDNLWDTGIWCYPQFHR